MDQPKIERLLRLMKLLTANNTLTVEDIALRLGISPRSVYRYIDTFRDAGFVVKKVNNCPKLDTDSPYFKDISELIHFTEEEAYILKSAIESIDETNVLKQNLKKKLYTVYDYNILADTLVSGKNGRNVQRLVQAFEKKKQVVLMDYSSAHGNDVRDRVVEAYAFTTNYVQVWCYCPDERTNKLFKVSRINGVEILSEPWQYEAEHKVGFIDVFRISSDVLIPVRLKLNLRAANLLMEEYPLASREMVQLTENTWLLETMVCSLEGVGRFVMGLPGDVEILDGEELRGYVRDVSGRYFESLTCSERCL